MDAPLWMIRPSARVAGASGVRGAGTVSLGVGRELGGLPAAPDRNALYEVFRALYPTWRSGRHRAACVQLFCFIHEMREGDPVLTWDAEAGVWRSGTLVGPARWDPSFENPFVRDVVWEGEITREQLGSAERNALALLQTLFAVDPARVPAIRAAAQASGPAAPLPPLAAHVASAPPAPSPVPADGLPRIDLADLPWSADLLPPEPTPAPQVYAPIVPAEPAAAPAVSAAAPAVSAAAPPRVLADTASPSLAGPTLAEQFASISAQADHLIERCIADLGPARVRLLVAGALRAMGFPHKVAERPDGAEIFTPASGSRERAMVVLRVHPRPEEPLGASTALAFCEGLESTQRGLLVALGGFTPAAREAAAPHGARCTLLDLPELRRAVLDHYDRMDLESRSLLPLTRIYWPLRS